MTTVADGIIECLTVEVVLKKSPNVFVSCIYRTPGSSIVKTIDAITKMLHEVKNKRKNIILCGDFNINLLNYNFHSGTKEFVDELFSYGLYPVINKPSRITEDSATLIDNFFVNTHDCIVKSGLLINDISDHLPIFIKLEGMHMEYTHVARCKYTRMIGAKNVDAFCGYLSKQNWDVLYNCNDVNVSYDYFVKIFCELYNKSCPLSKTTRKSGNTKPWLTRSLLNACNKKNRLYKEFVKTKNVSVLKKYKLYKNKLTSVIRFSERLHYNKLLEAHKSNIKATWQVLNSVIKKGVSDTGYPKEFAHNGKIVSDKLDISNKFNEFFVNVGPNLAKNIKVCDKDFNIYKYLKIEILLQCFWKV